MKIQNQVCTFAQAKTLCQLGIIQKGAFTWLFDPLNSRHDISAKSPEELSLLRASHPNSKEWACREMNEWFSAFTVAELGVMLPTFIAGEELGSLIIQHSVTTKKQKEWYCHYYGLTKNVIAPLYGWSMADAMANTLIYLLEWGELTPAECNSRLLNS